MHTVADVFCVGCNERLGWYYHKAADHGQKYKESEYSVFIALFAHEFLDFQINTFWSARNSSKRTHGSLMMPHWRDCLVSSRRMLSCNTLRFSPDRLSYINIYRRMLD